MIVAPGISKIADVCGGDAVIVNTRIPVWVLVGTHRLGASEADLLRAYPSLRAEDLANAWAYAQQFPNEIEADIEANENA